MGITTVENDRNNLTTKVVADFEAPIEKVWQLWADPRKLERWWGPPGFPATFEKHELRPGGEMSYYMTGPEGERHRGWWQVGSVEAPTNLEVTDGFADEQGEPATDMPVMTMHTQLSEHDGGTRVEIRSEYENPVQMDQIMEMGGLEGMRESMGQMDAVLED